MSFWANEETGQVPEKREEMDLGGARELIPGGTVAEAVIEDGSWQDIGRDDPSKGQCINLAWSIVQPEQLRGRKVFQKLYITDPNPYAKDDAAAAKRRQKDRDTMLLIDGLTGDNMRKSGKKPTDDSMAVDLTNKPIAIKVDLWSMPDNQNPGEMMSGNRISWIGKAGPDRTYKVGEVQPPKPMPRSSGSTPAGQTSGNGWVEDDDIPFD